MKILQIVSSSRLSGAEKHVAVLSERLQQRGHAITALCPPGGWLPDALRAARVPVLEMPMHGLSTGPTALRLNRIIREENFDLIHSHLTCATYYGYLMGLMTRLPVATSVHVRSRDIVYRRLFPTRRNHIITVSEWVRDGFVTQGVPAEQVHTIYNGTEFGQESFAEAAPAPLSEIGAERTIDRTGDRTTEGLPVRVELSLPPGAELIGIFARVGDFKGHPLLVEAARQIVDARPRAYIVCVGAVDPATQQTLWESAAKLGVAERFRFTGQRDDAQRLMSEMDVITLPSKYEACSMAIIEAMALGKPVIATRAGGNPELVRHEETGLLIERDPRALAAALIGVLADVPRRRQMGEAARTRALALFSAETMVNNIEALYRRMAPATAAPLSPAPR